MYRKFTGAQLDGDLISFLNGHCSLSFVPPVCVVIAIAECSKMQKNWGAFCAGAFSSELNAAQFNNLEIAPLFLFIYISNIICTFPHSNSNILNCKGSQQSSSKLYFAI